MLILLTTAGSRGEVAPDTGLAQPLMPEVNYARPELKLPCLHVLSRHASPGSPHRTAPTPAWRR